MKFNFKMKRAPRVNVVRLAGVISASSGGLSGSTLNDASTAAALNKAFEKGKPKAVALVINSPGGSPVQSSLIGARIRRLSEKHDVPVLAFCEDVAASGGYWLACAADEIFVDDSSVVGSIGVISASFGFHELLERQGIERRVHTAGESKSMMDPFRPENPDDVARLKALQLQIHETFISHVQNSRGDRLTRDDIFTGEVFVGQKAVDIGLVDGVGHMDAVLRDRFGDDVKIIGQKSKASLAKRLGVAQALNPMAQIEERALWAQYGL